MESGMNMEPNYARVTFEIPEPKGWLADLSKDLHCPILARPMSSKMSVTGLLVPGEHRGRAVIAALKKSHGHEASRTVFFCQATERGIWAEVAGSDKLLSLIRDLQVELQPQFVS